LVLAPEHNHAAVLRAPCHVVHAARGDHVVARSPVEPVGSYTQVGPRALRPLMVSRTRSRFTEVAITGPSHSSTAGMARPRVLPDCDGPSTTTDARGSAASSIRRRSA